MAEFTPSSLNAPETVFTHTFASKGTAQVYVNGSSLQSGDVLNIKLSTNVTGTAGNAVNASITVNNVDPVEYTGHFSQKAGNTVTLTLEQTAGTLRTVEWEVVIIE